MATLILQLDPAKLSNPDLDIRHRLPGLLIERSGRRLVDGGYDYAANGDGPPCLLLFLETEDPDGALPSVIEVLTSERVQENDLSAVPVAIEDGEQFKVVHPPNFAGSFQRPARGY